MNIEYLNWDKMKKDMRLEEKMLKDAFNKWTEFSENKEKFSIPSAVNAVMDGESSEAKAKAIVLIGAILLELNTPTTKEQELNYIS